MVGQIALLWCKTPLFGACCATIAQPRIQRFQPLTSSVFDSNVLCGLAANLRHSQPSLLHFCARYPPIPLTKTYTALPKTGAPVPKLIPQDAESSGGALRNE